MPKNSTYPDDTDSKDIEKVIRIDKDKLVVNKLTKCEVLDVMVKKDKLHTDTNIY